jgi:transketolase
MPSWEIFGKQNDTYKREVLPPEVTALVSVEAGSTFGWSRWLGPRGLALGVDRFGASAPAEVIMEKFGLTPQAVAQAVRKTLG